MNFGQRAFANALPSGFKALCTQNLADPAIVKPSQYFDINLRVGTAAAFNVTGKGFQPDLTWIKGPQWCDRSCALRQCARCAEGLGVEHHGRRNH